MWISKKKFQKLEKRIADLEGKVQGQQRLNKIMQIKPICIENDSVTVEKILHETESIRK